MALNLPNTRMPEQRLARGGVLLYSTLRLDRIDDKEMREVLNTLALAAPAKSEQTDASAPSA